MRDVADQVGITERAAHRIVGDLVREGAIKKSRHGRGNRYELNPELPLRHPLEQHGTVGRLLRAVSQRR